jgi:hypothetical protein
MITDVSEDFRVFIFRATQPKKGRYLSLKRRVLPSFKPLQTIYPKTQSNTPVDSNSQQCQYENLTYKAFLLKF